MARRCPHDIPTFLPSKLRIHRAFLGSSQHFLTAASGTGGHLYLKPTAVRRERKRRVQKSTMFISQNFHPLPHKVCWTFTCGFYFCGFFLAHRNFQLRVLPSFNDFFHQLLEKKPVCNQSAASKPWVSCNILENNLLLISINFIPKTSKPVAKKMVHKCFLDVYKQISKNSHASTRTTLYMANAAPK